jgi:hypothetical protein
MFYFLLELLPKKETSIKKEGVLKTYYQNQLLLRGPHKKVNIT